MAELWEIKVMDRGGGNRDLVMFDEFGVEQTPTLKNNFNRDLIIGPSFGSELIAAGLNNAVQWNAPDGIWRVQFDPDVVTTGQPRVELGNIIDAHDPTDPDPFDEYEQRLAQLKIDAQAIIDDGGESVAAVAFATEFLSWSDLLP